MADQRTRPRAGWLAGALLLAGCASTSGTPVAGSPVAPEGAPHTTPTPASASPGASQSAAVTPLAAPDMLAILCDASGSHIDVPAVRARSDGVHLEARTGEGKAAQVVIGLPDGETVGGVDGSATLGLGPGTYGLRCVEPFDLPWVPFRVEDPERLYVSPELTCADRTGTTGDGGDVQPVPAATAIGFLRTRMLLQATDLLEPTGYPDLPSGRIRLVRLGQVVAIALVGLAGGVPVVVTQEHCTGLDVWRN